jgi:hypothetical protein
MVRNSHGILSICGGILSLLTAHLAHAAPCCSGASLFPALITGDESQVFSATLGVGRVIGDAPAQGLPVFRFSDDEELTQTLRVDAASIFWDRWQVGLSLPLQRRSHELGPIAHAAFSTSTSPVTSSTGTGSIGLGDLTFNSAYEILPEWDYSVWKPHAYLFARITAPTGGSIYELKTQSGLQGGLLNVRGRGFWTLGLGGIAVKTWHPWTLSLLGELHRSLPRSFETSLEVTPGIGASGIIALNHSFFSSRFWLGGSVGPLWEEGILTQGDVNATSAAQVAWNTSLTLGARVTDEWTSSLNYTDQTLLGPVSNSTLSRTLSLQISKAWLR